MARCPTDRRSTNCWTLPCWRAEPRSAARTELTGTVAPEALRLRQTFTPEQLAEMAAGSPGPEVFDAVDGVNGAVSLRFDDDA